MEMLKKTAAFRIEKQTEGCQPDEVTALSLFNVPFLPELFAPFRNLSKVTLVGMKPPLRTLETLLKEGSNLSRVDVSDNAISVPAALPVCPSMKVLLLSNNKIDSIEELERLATICPNLEVLDLTDNDVNTPNHFNKVFEIFPQLKALNSLTKDGQEVDVSSSDSDEDDEEEEEEGEEEEGEEDEEDSSDSEGDDDNQPENKRVRHE